MSPEARRAIENELAFLEDNLYRHENFAAVPDKQAIKEHKEAIEKLKMDLLS